MGKIPRKRCVVLAGGYDVVCEPEMGYGNMLGGIRKLVVTTVFRVAELVTTVCQVTTEEARDKANIPSKKIRLIYHGSPRVDRGALSKENLVINVALVNSVTLKLKGIELLLRSVLLLPPSAQC